MTTGGVTVGELEYANRFAANKFDEWNDIAGVFEKGTGYYYEILQVIEDSVKIGVKVAVYGINADLSNLDKADLP